MKSSPGLSRHQSSPAGNHLSPILLGLTALLCLFSSESSAQNCVQWVQRTDVGTPGKRYGHAMAYDSQRGVTVFFGGAYSEVASSTESFYNETWEYDGISRWTSITMTGPSPPPRANHGMCYFQDGGTRYILMAGGRNNSGRVIDAWVYSRNLDGTGTWTEIPAHGQPYVHSYGLVFDEVRKLAVLAGGIDFANFDEPIWDVWEWNGIEWRSGLHIPSGRNSFAIAYDPLRSAIRIQGGRFRGGSFDNIEDNLYTFSNNQWTSTPAPSGLDLARDEHAMVHDFHRDRLVLFGGRDQSPPLHMEYNQAEGWRAMAIRTPEGRAQPAMVYDSRRGVTVLFGGVGGTRYDDTWELVPVRPVVTLLDPQLQQSCEFTDEIFRASVTAPAGATFQWLHDGQPVPGGNSQYLTLRSVTPSDAGQYSLSVTDPCGNTVVSPAYSFVVHSAPRITGFDTNRQEVCPGGSVTFLVSATSRLLMTFQWYKRDISLDVPIPGATAETLTLNALTHTNTGRYFVEVRNGCDYTRSRYVHLQVGPSILQQPQSATGDVCAASSFSVQADGVGTLRYQWRLDGAKLSNDDYFAGVNSPLLEIGPLLYAHEGNYDVIVSDDCGPINAVTSSVVKLTVKPGPEWWLRATNGPSPRAAPAMAYDSARQVTVLFGGWQTNSAPNDLVTLNDLWEWDGARWTLRIPHSPTNGWERVDQFRLRPTYTNYPVDRAQHNLVYDSGRGRLILFGGQSRTPGQLGLILNDLWEWDGAQWHFKTTSGPVHRLNAGMAYDSHRRVTVMTGGFLNGPGDPVRETVWEWDGVQWSAKQPMGDHPETNYDHQFGGMAYDSFRRTALFGPASSENYPWEFWMWDGSKWTHERAPSALSRLLWGDLVFDSYRRRGVWFGGYPGPPTNTTAFFDGKNWELLPTSPQWPRGRFDAGMAYDSARHATVMFGGNTGDGRFEANGETWELIAVDQPLINEQPASQYRQPGQTAIFNVSAVAPGAITYQWFKGATPLANGGRVSGATSAELQIANATESDAGQYQVGVMNDCGSTMSMTAILTLNPEMQIFAADKTLTLIWSDTAVVLEQGDSPAGPWVEVKGASSPFHPSTFAPAKFFRLRQL